LENGDPAEPDDPNSSSLNPNEHKNRGWAGWKASLKEMAACGIGYLYGMDRF
jgi:hypothetical protein